MTSRISRNADQGEITKEKDTQHLLRDGVEELEEVLGYGALVRNHVGNDCLQG
jgi:hypothetical protein